MQATAVNRVMVLMRPKVCRIIHTMRSIITLILGGGKGTRLYPLTKLRSKPAVPLAGKYRLIDIPISNCLNSGLNQIYVLTQFNSVSLNRHINQAFKFDLFGRGIRRGSRGAADE